MTASSRKEEGLTAALRRAIQAIEVCRAMSSTTPTGRERANRDIEEIERLIAGNTTPPPAAAASSDLAEIREHVAAYEWVATDSPYLTLCAEERRTLLRLYDALTLERENENHKTDNSELIQRLAQAQSELDAARRDAAIVAERYLVPYHRDERVFVCAVCGGRHPNQWEVEHGASCEVGKWLAKSALSPPPREDK